MWQVQGCSGVTPGWSSTQNVVGVPYIALLPSIFSIAIKKISVKYMNVMRKNGEELCICAFIHFLGVPPGFANPEPTQPMLSFTQVYFWPFSLRFSSMPVCENVALYHDLLHLTPLLMALEVACRLWLPQAYCSGSLLVQPSVHF